MIEKIKEILYKNTGLIDIEITEETNLKNDLGLNSLDFADLVCIVEDEFDIEIPNRAIKGFKTVGDVIRFIEAQ